MNNRRLPLRTPSHRFRRPLPLLAVGALTLLLAILAGLFRSGWDSLPLASYHPLTHGPLMICGFLGTLISLEKAVAVGKSWAYLSPATAGLGGLWLILRPDPVPAGWFFIAASTLFVLVLAALLARHIDLAGIVMLMGSLTWLGGNILWTTGNSIPLTLPWWMAFPTLIIVGERLELSRIASPPRSANVVFLGSLSLYLLGLVVFLRNPDLGLRLQGLGLLLLATWLFRYDMARRTVRLPDRHRYTALCLLTGYFWLGVCGAMCLFWGANLGGLRYDALVHALLLGFVFAMIFGHAPIIAPMLLRRDLNWKHRFYAPLVLMQVTLLARMVGDLGQWHGVRSWAALGNALAILMFLALTARAAITGRRLPR